MDRTERLGCVGLGCAGLAFIAVIAGGVVLIVVGARDAKREQASDDRRAAPREEPWPTCAGSPAKQDSIDAPLAVRDPHRLDGTEPFAQAMTLARRLEPSARLVAMTVPSLASGGTFDSSAAPLMSYDLEYHCLERGKVPGEDRHSGSILVVIDHGKMTARRVEVFTGLGDIAGLGGEAPCGTVAAWKAAVRTGVPADARASFVLAPGFGPLAGTPTWIIDVPGHADLRRQVDAKRCARVLRDGRLVE